MYPIRFSVDPKTGGIKGGFGLKDFEVGAALTAADVGKYPGITNLVPAEFTKWQMLKKAIVRWDYMDRNMLNAAHLTPYLPGQPEKKDERK